MGVDTGNLETVDAGVAVAVLVVVAHLRTVVVLGTATVVVSLKMTTGGTPRFKYVLAIAVQRPQSTCAVAVVVVVQMVLVGPQVQAGRIGMTVVHPGVFAAVGFWKTSRTSVSSRSSALSARGTGLAVVEVAKARASTTS